LGGDSGGGDAVCVNGARGKPNDHVSKNADLNAGVHREGNEPLPGKTEPTGGKKPSEDCNPRTEGGGRSGAEEKRRTCSSEGKGRGGGQMKTPAGKRIRKGANREKKAGRQADQSKRRYTNAPVGPTPEKR